MKKAGLLKITGTHALIDAPDNEEADVISVMNPGELIEKDGIYYIFYEEMLDGTEGVTKNRITVSPNEVKLSKKGAVTSEMVFRENEDTEAGYNTGAGNIMVGNYTEKVIVNKRESDLYVEILYSIRFNLEKMADCRIEIEFIEK